MKRDIDSDAVLAESLLAESDFDAALPLQLHLNVSGTYRRTLQLAPIPLVRRDELRLDVDGRYPQMTASGVIRRLRGLTALHWVASLRPAGKLIWQGNIWMKDGDTALLAHTRVRIAVIRTPFRVVKATVVFSGGAGGTSVQEYEYAGPNFDRVTFEFDSTSDANPAMAIHTHAHPNRPATLPAETLSIQAVYNRAGFEATVSPPGAPIPIAGAGVDALWSDTEMHDAMQAHWSHWSNSAQWSMWVFHAALSDQGTGLGGIMFDDIGPNHRQGTAIFTESFIRNAPAGDPQAAAWVQRMRFWTACHEMGHAFNLAHSWQKSLGTPWIPLADEPEARSFMNYPYSVTGGQTAFFADFEFRFSDSELLFMRHAPRRFVQMGNADWFDHHGFEQAQTTPEPPLTLVLRLNRERPVLQFMEPAMIELKATNVSGQPMVVDEDLLGPGHALTLVVKKDGHAARLWQPFATACHQPSMQVLPAGESIYKPLFIGAGKGGWLIAEPGRYTVQACVRLETGEDIVSAPLELRVAVPSGAAEENFAQDLFTQDVARVLAFDGTRQLTAANDRLREAAQLPAQHALTMHAKVALGLPLRHTGKLLVPDDGGQPVVLPVPPQPEEAASLLHEALVYGGGLAASTLGHVEYRDYVERYAGWLASEGEGAEARQTMEQACTTLQERAVKPAVIAQMRAFGESLGSASTRGTRARGKREAAK